MWDIVSGPNGCSFQSTGEADKFTDCESLGRYIGNGTSYTGFSIEVGSITNFNQGLVVTNPGFFEINSCFVEGNDAAGCTYFTVNGANSAGSVNFDTLTLFTGSNETVFYIDPEIQSNIDAINIRSCSQEGGLNAEVFGSGSLTQKDNKVLAVGNSIIGDTVPGGLLSLSGNALPTEFTGPNTPTLVAGVWAVEDTSQCAGSINGRITYLDVRDTTMDIDISLSVEPVSGNNIVIRAYIAKNGVEISNSGKSTTADSDKAGNISLAWRVDTSTDNYYEIFIENKTNDTSVTVIDATLRIP